MPPIDPSVGTALACPSAKMSYQRKITAERDAWTRAVPGRSFEVSLASDGGQTKWHVVLIERGNVVAVGKGTTWEIAFTDALDEAENGRAGEHRASRGESSGSGDRQ